MGRGLGRVGLGWLGVQLGRVYMEVGVRLG